MSSLPSPFAVNEWFVPPHQRVYVDAIAGQCGLTRRQAACFVRLWGYATVQSASAQIPLQTLHPAVGKFECSHREAAELFYCDQARGSERSAGMMVDQLVARHLVRREPFDGGPTRLSLQIPASFLPKAQAVPDILCYADAFDVRRDAARVAGFLEAAYGWVSDRSETTSFKIIKVLRRFAQQYPAGLRVLRAAANDDPVGFAALYPTHPDSEENFHLPPSSSMHLSTLNGHDPIQVASPGDPDCYAVFVRSWQLQPLSWNYAAVCQFLQDSQATLRQMQQDFPNLCDLYGIAIHPATEALALAVGFKPMKADPRTALRWLHTPLDHFLNLDIDEALVEFDFGSVSH
ncbi:MAG: hypothetical protein AAGF98_13810 [Cyanobacteria bacterium P01_H01_bin.153]